MRDAEDIQIIDRLFKENTELKVQLLRLTDKYDKLVAQYINLRSDELKELEAIPEDLKIY